MMHGGCRCCHHWVTKILVVLAWLAAIGFWWVSRSGDVIWGMNAEHLFRDVVILTLLAFSTKFCGCCRMGKMMGKNSGMGGMCKHEMGCTCGDCDRCK